MTQLGVANTSTVSKPRTTAATTTYFARFGDDAAFGAHGTDGRRCHGCWCTYVDIGQNINTKTWKQCHYLVCTRIYLHGVNVGLTFAGLCALRPAVTNVLVANTSAVLIPSTVRSATTNSAGFLERATLQARHRVGDR